MIVSRPSPNVALPTLKDFVELLKSFMCVPAFQLPLTRTLRNRERYILQIKRRILPVVRSHPADATALCRGDSRWSLQTALERIQDATALCRGGSRLLLASATKSLVNKQEV
jgi:hypothetical protein